MVNNFRISRRTCLKGLGASLALPLLETMGWADLGKQKTVKPPVRLGFMYMPHGVIMDQFWPANAESFLSSPPPALEAGGSAEAPPSGRQGHVAEGGRQGIDPDRGVGEGARETGRAEDQQIALTAVAA